MVITMATTAAATAVFLFNFMPAVSAALVVLQHLGLRRSLARLMVDSLVACRLLLLLLMMIFMMMVSLVDKPPFTFASTVAVVVVVFLMIPLMDAGTMDLLVLLQLLRAADIAVVVEYPQATIDQDLLLLTTPSAASVGNLLHGLTNSRTQKLPGRPSTMKFSLLSLLLLLQCCLQVSSVVVPGIVPLLSTSIPALRPLVND
jgi:hypothetical protein